MEAGGSSPGTDEAVTAVPDNAGPGAKWTVFVPVLVAVVTATVGTLLSLWVEARDRASEAENAARVLDENLRAADDALQRSIIDGRYRFYDFEVSISLDDEKRLAEKLGNTYRYVAEAESGYSLQVARAREEHEFVQDDIVQLTCARETVALGRWALYAFTAAPHETLPILPDYEDACQEETVELVSERFYDYFVDGNGTLACNQANASDQAIASMQAERPSCNQVINRPEQPPKPHPYAEAEFSDEDVEGELATVLLKSNAKVGTLEWTDEDSDNVWHLNEVEGLKPVGLSGAPKSPSE